jgi:hypothetical protein
MYNEPDYYDYEHEPSEIENVFTSIVDAEVNKRTSKYFEKMKQLEEQHEKDVLRVLELANERDELKKTHKQGEAFSVFKSQINDKNIENVCSFLNLEKINIDFSGMHSDQIPAWFRLVAKHYPDRDKVFSLLDLFEINYPDWAKTFKMPFDYGEEELDLIFSKIGRMYVCNSCIFSDNMGFFYTYYSRHKNLNTLFERESSVEIPWNLFLQNKLLATEKYFARIIESLKRKESRSDYFYKIQDYQELSPEQAERMFDFLPMNNLYDIHKRFIELNNDIVKKKPELAIIYKDKMSDNQYSSFYYLNFPIEMQKDFIRNYRGMGRYESKFDLVKKMNISKKEKLAFLQEINEQMLREK